MMSNRLHARPGTVHRILAFALSLGLAMIVVACGGGGYTPQAVSQADRRALSEEFLTRTAINYSPYRTAASVDDLPFEVITPANVLQDLRLVQATGIGTIRLFTSSIFSRTVRDVIRDNGLDLKVQLGAYPNPINSPADEAANIVELDAAIQLANQFPGLVLAVSVGNETMVEWSTHKVPVADMARYIKYVRDAVAQPVTTNDNFLFWQSVPAEIGAVIDFAAVHVYPFLDTFYNPSEFDWRQKSVAADRRAQAMVDAAVAAAKDQLARARKGLAQLNLAHLPVVIGETGWTAVDTPGGPNLAFRAHPVNQKMYFDAMQAWAREGRADPVGPKAVFVFQAFDEPWKQGDDGWGLFNANREARYVVQSLGTCGVTWTCEAGSYTPADAVKWVPPTIRPAVPSARYTLYADMATAGETRATGLRWDPFASTSWRDASVAPASADGGAHLEITPNPVNFGWGLFLRAADAGTENLADFAAGRLNFRVRSDGYPGQIEVGISTDTEDRDIQEAFVQVAPGQYGYCNSNVWCDVSIPVSAFLAVNPKLDLRLVKFRFVIADRYSFTGKPQNLTGLPLLRIDDIHWSR